MMIDGNMIMSGVVSKFVNDIGDKLKNKIRNADENRKSSEQNIETRIYQVTIDAINVSTSDKYKGQEKLYDAAECILRGFKSKKENIEVAKMGLKMLESQITNDMCEDFLWKLRDEICRDKNDILYKEINLIQSGQLIEDVDKGFKRSEQNQKDIRDDIHEGFERDEQNNQETQRKLDYLVEKSNNKEANFYSDVENRAEEYAAKWEKNVFLNDFNEEDENPRPKVKLNKIYIEECLPRYIWKTNSKPSEKKLNNLLNKYINNNSEINMLLILGQPGIGKSTLITWIIANYVEKRDDFLVYQFASDLKDVNWQANNLFVEILNNINLKKDNLQDKVLILDGFDEIHTNGEREKILNKLKQEITGRNSLRNFSLVITCRENYVNELGKIECDFITLQTWDENQIKCFCEVYREESGRAISTSKIDKLLENKEVFGIPLILYMVLALDISAENSESLVDVYDQIFSIERSSIYDRCIQNSRYGGEHRISENNIKQLIHQISQRIAFWIFENNSEKAFISQKEYEDICNIVAKENSNRNEDIKIDVLIGNYMKYTKYYEGIGTEELQFVHRSIYEYFVVLYFFDSLRNLTTIEEVAGKLGELLKYGHLSHQILEFTKYKFDNINQYSLSDVTKETFQIMLRDGMTYHMKGKYKNIITCELNIFANMLEVVHLWSSELGKLDNIVCYLQYNRRRHLNLRNTDLSRTDLSGVDLSEADLGEADLSEADLSGTNLSEANLGEANLGEANLGEANLREANLSETYLSKADLSRTNLSEADLRGANLREADLGEADLRGADLRGANLSEADLRGANLNEINLRGADLRGADLRGADLSGEDLISVNLIGANLRGANLRGANLSEANLSEADLNEADLIGVDLIGTDLIRANLRGANLRGANLRGADLSEADLSETIFDEDLFEMLYEKYDLSKSNIFVFNISDVVSYNDYVLENNSKKG